MRLNLLLAVALLVLAVSPAAADAPASLALPVRFGDIAALQVGAAEGPQFPSLVGNGGDLRGWRNLQGGMPGSPNLDIGAGSTAEPGDVVLNYDVGRSVLVYDGHKRLVARFGPGGIVFYRRPRIARR